MKGVVLIKNFDNRKEKLELVANKMRIRLVDSEENKNLYPSKMLDISKQNRPEIEKYLQKQLESIC